MQPKDKDDDLKPYRKLGLTLLQTMGILAVLGIAVTLLLVWLFNR